MEKYMVWEVFLKQVNDVKQKKPIWFGLEADLVCSQDDIEFIENELSVKLTNEYKTFLMNFGGGYFAFSNIFSGDKDSEWYLISKNKELNLLEDKSFLAISENEVGDYYGYKVKDGVCESIISLFDHEENEIKKTIYDDFYNFVLKKALCPS